MAAGKSINEEAAEWVVRLASDQSTGADESAFRAWLGRSEEHRRAYADNAALWDGLGLLADNDEARAILRRPRQRLQRPRFPSRRQAVFGGIGVAAAATVAAVVASPLLAMRDYRTVPGEQRRIALADGSVVLLNTDSVLRVRLGSSERRLYLDRGQAFFQASKDPDRPFRVFVGAGEVRALGTAFDVRVLDQGARVTLEEGRVAIFTAAGHSATAAKGLLGSAAAGPAAVLTPGQQALLTRVKAPAVQAADLRATQAWRSGRLFLEDSSLADAAAELNRYGGPRIVVADKAAGEVRISGVFHTHQPEAFVASVTEAFPITVVRQDAGEIVLARRT